VQGRMGMSALAVVVLLLAGCGGGGDADPPPTTATTSQGPTTIPADAPTGTGTDPTSLPTGGAEPPASASPYASTSVSYTDNNGWSYRFVPDLTGLAVEATANIETSPPGEARVAESVTAPPGFPGVLEPNTPGRTPPVTQAEALAFFPLEGEQPYYVASFCDIDVAIVRGIRTSGLLCANAFFTDATKRRLSNEDVELSGDQAEAFVQSIVATLNSGAPVIRVVVGQSGTCTVNYHPDGMVEVAETTGDASCELE
jgi:hypothetical protein